MTVLVFGSLNMDLVVQAPRLPTPGETLLGTQFDTIAGGKGANQAVAAARQEIPTRLVGRVGGDAFGETLRQTLANDGVNVETVDVDADTHTGVAAIAVSSQGENHIVVVPGANRRVGQADLRRLETHLAESRVLLMQYEIPVEIVAEAAEKAHAQGVTVILDPAPVPIEDISDIFPHVDILTPNQTEAAQLVGFPVETQAQAREAIAVLQSRGVAIVIITLGAQGGLWGTGDGCFHQSAFPVEVVDTVAAGDAFNGGLAAALYRGQSLQDAVKWASATAALSVTRSGAQPSLPTRSQVAAFLAKDGRSG